MTLPEVGAIQFSQSASSEVHARRQVTAVRLNEEGDSPKGQRERGTYSPIQDQVTVEKHCFLRFGCLMLPTLELPSTRSPDLEWENRCLVPVGP